MWTGGRAGYDDGGPVTQVDALSGMSDADLVAARDNSAFSPSLVDQQISKRGLQSGFGRVLSNVGSYVGDAWNDAARRVSAANQVPAVDPADVEATRNVGPNIARAASDIGDWFTKPVVPERVGSERNVGRSVPLEMSPSSERRIGQDRPVPVPSSERHYGTPADMVVAAESGDGVAAPTVSPGGFSPTNRDDAAAPVDDGWVGRPHEGARRSVSSADGLYDPSRPPMTPQQRVTLLHLSAGPSTPHSDAPR
jgi:hypothetical protein